MKHLTRLSCALGSSCGIPTSTPCLVSLSHWVDLSDGAFFTSLFSAVNCISVQAFVECPLVVKGGEDARMVLQKHSCDSTLTYCGVLGLTLIQPVITVESCAMNQVLIVFLDRDISSIFGAGIQPEVMAACCKKG